MNQIKIVLVIIISSFLLMGCANIFNGIVMKNQCRKCELIDKYANQVVFKLEGCGAENTKLKRQCIEKAWEISREGNLCNFNIVCETWRKDK